MKRDFEPAARTGTGNPRSRRGFEHDSPGLNRRRWPQFQRFAARRQRGLSRPGNALKDRSRKTGRASPGQNPPSPAWPSGRPANCPGRNPRRPAPRRAPRWPPSLPAAFPGFPARDRRGCGTPSAPPGVYKLVSWCQRLRLRPTGRTLRVRKRPARPPVPAGKRARCRRSQKCRPSGRQSD